VRGRRFDEQAKVIVAGVASLALFVGATGFASADKNNGVETAFLCPIVGDGVLGAPGIDAIEPPAGTSILPGNNQLACMPTSRP
jgi:hypothetical protein